jgi:hypothetical protein
MTNFVNLEEEYSDRFDPTPKATRKVKKHSSRPEMFVQLRLAGPEGRMVDPSKILIIDPSESPTKTFLLGAEQCMSSHVIVEMLEQEPKEKNEFQLHVPTLDEKGDEEEEEDQEELTATSSTDFVHNQQSETGPTILEEQNKKELGNEESDLRNKDIESIPEAPGLESPLPSPERMLRRNRSKTTVTSIIGSPNKRPHVSRRSLLGQEAPMSAPSRPRPSLLDKLETRIASRRSVLLAPASVGEITPDTAEVGNAQQQPPISVPTSRPRPLLPDKKLERRITTSRRSVLMAPSSSVGAITPETEVGNNAQHQAPMSVPSRTRPSLLLANLETRIESRRSVILAPCSPSVGEPRAEKTQAVLGDVPPTPSGRRRSTMGVVRSLRVLTTTPRSRSKRKVVSRTAADRLGNSSLRSIFDD